MNSESLRKNAKRRNSRKKADRPRYKGEETFKQAKRENKTRIKSLLSGGKRANKLAHKLYRCRRKNRCNSPACAVCSRLQRRRHVRQVLRLFDDSKKKFFVTIIPTTWFVNARALRQFNPKLAKNGLRKQLERIGIRKPVIAGGLEATYKFKRRQICVHWHLVVDGASTEKIRLLRRYYAEKRGLQIKKIKTGQEGAVLSYSWKRKTYGTDTPGRKKKRPPSKVENALLRFLDRHSFQDLMFLRGLRFYGDRITRINKSASLKKKRPKKDAKWHPVLSAQTVQKSTPFRHF